MPPRMNHPPAANALAPTSASTTTSNLINALIKAQ
jgi:hypothetical protein